MGDNGRHYDRVTHMSARRDFFSRSTKKSYKMYDDCAPQRKIVTGAMNIDLPTSSAGWQVNVVRSSDGQTLIALLIFMILAITITTTAAAITIINTQSNSSYVNGQAALSNAEAGIENALLQLERNNNYSGETMTLGSGSVVVAVSGSTTKTITAIGTAGTNKRTVTATATISNTAVTETSWSETP